VRLTVVIKTSQDELTMYAYMKYPRILDRNFNTDSLKSIFR